MEADAKALSLLHRRKPGHALDQAFYCDPDIFALDMARIFQTDWLFVAPACTMPKPGSYITHRVGGYGRAGPRPADPRLSQQLPPSRLDPVQGRCGPCGQAGLPLSPVDL